MNRFTDTKDDLTNTRQRLDETHATVEGLKNELKGKIPYFIHLKIKTMQLSS
jgi:hypothetical protein